MEVFAREVVWESIYLQKIGHIDGNAQGLALV